jgi:hypothetical protein
MVIVSSASCNLTFPIFPTPSFQYGGLTRLSDLRNFSSADIMTTKWMVHTAGTESTQNAKRVMTGKPKLEKPVE